MDEIYQKLFLLQIKATDTTPRLHHAALVNELSKPSHPLLPIPQDALCAISYKLRERSSDTGIQRFAKGPEPDRQSLICIPTARARSLLRCLDTNALRNGLRRSQ